MEGRGDGGTRRWRDEEMEERRKPIEERQEGRQREKNKETKRAQGRETYADGGATRG
eukprot:SAG11_NODE_21628_length_421_cov_1.487578_1_plen_56_part_10